MPCSHVRIEMSDGQQVSAIVCGPKRIRTCVKCLGIADRECDWKTGPGKTCDGPICAKCSVSPAPGKDLCPKHAEAWKTHPANVGSA